MEVFQHERLPDPEEYIRLLEVTNLDEREDEQVQVHCRLSTWLLDNVPPYFAISYTWGDANDTRSILVNGKVMPVTRNCELVLKQGKRYIGRRRIFLWCDAICIDQAGNGAGDEKGHQIHIMGDIYRRAQRVLACVGKHGNDSKFLLSILRQYSTFLCRVGSSCAIFPSREGVHQEIRDRWVETTIGSNAVDGMLRRMHESFCHFLTRDYFSRLWVLQELHLGKKVTIVCGDDSASMQSAFGLSHLILLGDYLDGFSRGDSDSLSFDASNGDDTAQQALRILHKSKTVTRVTSRKGMLRAGAIGTMTDRCLPSEVMHQARHLECTEPSDRIYGTLALTGWDSPIFPVTGRDRFDLGLEVLEAGLPHCPYPGMNYCHIIAINLELAGSPTAMLAEARRRRRYSDGDSSSSFMSGQKPLRADEASTRYQLQSWKGYPLTYDGQSWHMDRYSNPPCCIYVWPARGPCEESYEQATESLELSFIIPSNVRSGDWCLVPSLGWVDSIDRSIVWDEPPSHWPILLVRHDGLIFQDRMEIVGKGFAYGGTTDLYYELDGLILFDDCWNVEDALVLSSSFLPNGSFSDFLRNHPEDYMETGVCVEYGSSYVQCFPQHVERLLAISNDLYSHGFQDSSATHSVTG